MCCCFQERFIAGSPSATTGQLSEALQNQLSFITLLNADMERALVDRNNNALMRKDGHEDVHGGRQQQSRMDVDGAGAHGKEDPEDAVPYAKGVVTPLAQRVAPSLLENVAHKKPGGHDEEMDRAEYADKTLQVPVKKRSLQTRKGHGPEKQLTFLLPETPVGKYAETTNDENQNQGAASTPGNVRGLDLSGATATTPGLATTPMAIEVLSNLHSLGIDMKIDYEEKKKRNVRVGGHLPVFPLAVTCLCWFVGVFAEASYIAEWSFWEDLCCRFHSSKSSCSCCCEEEVKIKWSTNV